ncbi:MAG: MBL fold metallo-hydrolase [Proteobacteria bacterium]|nr:MBL fold metallo-hydrolase [Pseudomonadota bacterium]MBU1742094.1 MBL fold metallo-hydrolase [Pseudomonadota bacterium]
MKITCLGTGAAWGCPEHGCDCRACRTMRQNGESRLRTSFFVEAGTTLLVDPGPDLAVQMRRYGLPRPDAIAVSHAHADHFLGLDELWVYARQVPREHWRPIPLLATPGTWQGIAERFGYLVGRVIERREVAAGQTVDIEDLGVTPFAVNHGPFAPDAAGFVFEGRGKRVVYTGDFLDVIGPVPEKARRADGLLLQANFFHEPRDNRPHHMSFQRALDWLKRFDPQQTTYLVHMGVADPADETEVERFMKKRLPADPLRDPDTGAPYPPPATQDEWERAAEVFVQARGLPYDVRVAFDGQTILIE